MMATKDIIFEKDVANKKIIVVREFDAPVEQVWRAWTQHELLDRWWAPRPWKVVTKSMDFREGGSWLYAMEGPDGSRHYCRADYRSIQPNKSFSHTDAFTDENGNANDDFPGMNWNTVFSKSGTGTKVEIEISFKSEAHLNKIIEMGFQEGFTMALGNLDELFHHE